MNTQNNSADGTQSCELNAVPWHDPIEKRQFLDGLESMLSQAPMTDVSDLNGEAGVFAMNNRGLNVHDL